MIWLAKRKVKSNNISKRLEGIAELERSIAASRPYDQKRLNDEIEIIELLKQYINDADTKVATAVKQTLTRIALPIHIDDTLRFGTDVARQIAAAEILGGMRADIRDEYCARLAIESLIKKLESQLKRKRQFTSQPSNATAIGNTNHEPPNGSPVDEAVRASLRNHGSDAVIPLLIKAVDSTNVAEIDSMLREIPGSFDYLISALRNGSPIFRGRVARVLGQMKHLAAMEPLLSLLDDPDVSIRVAAVYALGELRHTGAITPLLGVLRTDPAPGVRQTAIESLLLIPHPIDLVAVREALTKETGIQDILAVLWRNKDQPMLTKSLVTLIEQVKSRRLDALLFVFNLEFDSSKIIDSILNRTQAHGLPYRFWVHSETPKKVLTTPRAQDPGVFMSLAAIEFRIMLGSSFALDRVEVTNFKGTDGVTGVVLSHWTPLAISDAA